MASTMKRVDSEESPTTTLSGNDLVGQDLVTTPLENVKEPSLDPRVRVTEADELELDEGLAERFSHLVFGRPDRAGSTCEKGEKPNLPIYVSGS
jgi:hypothetical protein